MIEKSRQQYKPKRLFKAVTVAALGLSVLAGCGESKQGASSTTVKSVASHPGQTGSAGQPINQSGSSEGALQFPPPPSQGNLSKINWQTFTENTNNHNPNSTNPTTALQDRYYAGPCVPIRNLDGSPLWRVKPGEMLMIAYPVTNVMGAWIFKIVNSSVDSKDYYMVVPDGINNNVNYNYPIENEAVPNTSFDWQNEIQFNKYDAPLVNYSPQNNSFTFSLQANANVSFIPAGTAEMEQEIPALDHDFNWQSRTSC